MWGPQHNEKWLWIVVAVLIALLELPQGLRGCLDPFAPYSMAPGYCTGLGQWLLFRKTKLLLASLLVLSLLSTVISQA